MRLSVIIPAHNEEGCLERTLRNLDEKLLAEKIDHELVVINDGSSDKTGEILASLQKQIPALRCSNSRFPPGFGYAIRSGLEIYTGDAAAIYMADASDSPDDLVRFFRTLETTGVDCVFGSRFMAGSLVVDYPWLKLFLNRLANTLIRILFAVPYNDTTNAFKLYKRETIEGLKPFLSEHFNLTLELPLKAIVRGYSYAVLPNSWNGRKTGASTFRIKEMGSRYFFILKECLKEKYQADFHIRMEYFKIINDKGKKTYIKTILSMYGSSKISRCQHDYQQPQKQ